MLLYQIKPVLLTPLSGAEPNPPLIFPPTPPLSLQGYRVEHLYTLVVNGIMENHILLSVQSAEDDFIEQELLRKFLVNKRRSIDEADWIIVENTHESIIDTSLFEQVQERIGKNSRHRMKNVVCEGEVKQRREAILNGVAFCAECGAPMTAAFIGKQKIFTYRCRKYVQCGTSACSSHSIKADEIESFILTDKWESKPDAIYILDCSELIGYDKETLLRWCQKEP